MELEVLLRAALRAALNKTSVPDALAKRCKIEYLLIETRLIALLDRVRYGVQG